MIDALFQDLKFAARQLQLNPGFTLTAMASLALGAPRGRVIRLVLREMAAVILTGVAAGVVAALYCGRFVEAQLFGVKASDLAVFL